MRIAIDIDDTLTDSFSYFIPFIAEYFHADPAYLEEHGISYCTLPASWKERELDFCRAYFDQVVEDTPFKPDAAAYVQRLYSLGHQIVIITGRNAEMYKDPDRTTRRELEKGGVPYHKLICTLDKADACVREKIDWFLDDSVANCTAVSERGIPVLLFTSRWNEGDAAPFRRAASWKEAFEILTGEA